MRRVLVVLAHAGLVLACGETPEPVPARSTPREAELELVATGGGGAGESEDVEPILGVVVPEQEVVLVAAAPGRIERLDVRVGTAVQAGQLLAKLDVHRDVNDLAAARASFRAAQAELDHIELELARARATRSETDRLEGIVSQAESREHRFAEQLAVARKRSAGASILARRSQIDEAEARIAEAELRAPFEGVITRRHLDPGARVNIQAPVLELVSTATRIRFAVPAHLAVGLAAGRRVRIALEGTEVPADVILVAPEIEPGLGFVLAEARMIEHDGPPPRIGTVVHVRWDPNDAIR